MRTFEVVGLTFWERCSLMLFWTNSALSKMNGETIALCRFNKKLMLFNATQRKQQLKWPTNQEEFNAFVPLVDARI